MIRNVSKVHHEFKLLGIKLFSADYVVTEIEESDEEISDYDIRPEINKFQFFSPFKNRMKYHEQVMFLEKLYRQNNNNIFDDDNDRK